MKELIMKWAVLTAIILAVTCAQASAASLLVADSANNVIYKYDAYTGAYSGVFTNQGLDAPRKMKFGPDGNLYVSNYGNNTITRYSPNGTYLGVFASTGLNRPMGFDWGPDGNLYVGNYGLTHTESNIVRFNGSTGAYMGVFIDNGLGWNPPVTGMVFPDALKFGPDGYLYISNHWYEVTRWTTDGNYVGRLEGLVQWIGTHQYLTGLDIYDGRIYALSADSAQVRRWALDIGAPIQNYLALPGPGATWYQDLLILPGGKLLVSEHVSKNVLAYDMNEGGSPAWFLSGGPEIGAATGLAVTPDYVPPAPPTTSLNSISYQGKLTNSAGQPVADGTYSAEFAIFDQQSGGSPLWASGPTSITTKDGLFTTALGPISAATLNTAEAWLETKVNGETLAPRVLLRAVPFAINARRAETAVNANYAETAGSVVGGVDYADTAGGLVGTPDDYILINAPGGLLIDLGNGVTIWPYEDGTWGSSAWSARELKENFNRIDPNEILEKISSLSIGSWNYKNGSTKHIGPMAQDFYQAFGVGKTDKQISLTDANGIALAAIQGLYGELKSLKAENDRLKERLSALEAGK